MRKNWLKETLIINKKEWYLYDFSEDEVVAEKLRREALDEGAKYAKVVMRKNTYFETYPEGVGYTENVYAVYTR